jgi:tetratricopeptide (TPR) repeat protein
MRRDLADALSHYEQARELLGDADPTPLFANLLRWSGSVLRDLGELDDAEQMYSYSFAVAELTGATSGQASALNCRAVIAQRRGDLDGATALYRRAARLATEAGEIRLAGMIEQNLGVLANIRGDLDGALVRYRAALRAFQEVSDEEAVSWVLNNMGMLLTDLGLPIRAEKSFQQGLEIARRRRDRHMEGVLQANYAECLIAMKKWDDAAAALDLALAIAEEGEDQARAGEARKFFGVLEREQGRLEAAEEYLEQALEIGRLVDDPLLVAEVMRERGELRQREGRREDAARDWVAARDGFVALNALLDADHMRARIASLGHGAGHLRRDEGMRT